MILTVIFDMDGVIVDTEPVHRYAYFKQFAELNINVTEECILHYWVFDQKYVSKVKETFGLEHDVEDLIQRKRMIFLNILTRKKI
jgi:beta-phosphoglucomutase-like phosphatase (HAD superfamily)